MRLERRAAVAAYLKKHIEDCVLHVLDVTSTFWNGPFSDEVLPAVDRGEEDHSRDDPRDADDRSNL